MSSMSSMSSVYIQCCLKVFTINCSTDSLSVMNNNESMADVKSNMKEGTKFPLKRSQSAVSFSTVVKDQLMQKTIGLGKLQGGTLKQWIQVTKLNERLVISSLKRNVDLSLVCFSYINILLYIPVE